MGTPVVSIITPCYNSENTVTDTIESILNQTFSDFELIIINDCSRDESQAIIESYQQKDSRVQVLNLEVNSGVATARNAGIQQSKGQYIAFCDSDDVWYPEKLELQLDLITRNKAAICFSSYHTINADGQIIGERLCDKDFINLTDMFYYNAIGNLTGMIDTHKVGKPNQHKRRHEDYLMWLELLRLSGPAVAVTKPLAGYRLHDSNLSGNKFKSLIWHYDVLRFVGVNPILAIWFSVIGRLVLLLKRAY